MYRKKEVVHFMHDISRNTANKTKLRTVPSLEITLHENILKKNSAGQKKKKLKIPISTCKYRVKTLHLDAICAIQLPHIEART